MNFSSINYRERDDFDSELSDLRKRHAYLDAAQQALLKERDDLSAQVVFLKDF